MSNFTIQDIFLQYGNEYVENHKLSDEQWKVFNAIRNCSTKNLGYHICTCKNVAKNTMVTIHAVIDTVLCVRAMLEKNGFKKNLAIY